MSTYETGSAADRSANGSPEGQSPDTPDIKERAVDSVAEVDAGAMYVAGVAGDEIHSVAHDVKDAARGFFDETRVQLSDQASTQQRRAADALRGTGDELEGMASGTGTSSRGMATSAVRALGQQTRRAADWLEQREPADVVREVRGYARRHTGAFLLIALGAGIVAGRMTRALMADPHNASAGLGGASRAQRPALAAGAPGAPGVTGVTADERTGSATGADGFGAGSGASGESTPIADALADQAPGDPLSSAAGATAANGQNPVTGARTAQGEWSPSGEARR
ncbi:hypothetical protein [Microbacterium trichothecenolyticum]|uniref:Uncharacterized protein n=1 Tax=Microbacterium trichothecenolyticum TaxID=69370 RepID=A0A0M2H9D8_MICTR|nr:hypothetical protein [Microbacterium trichothecenolyticum]KJL40749.1 hypothetical protein RS82_03365 [Microbacterium trichothecenolyticum]